MLTTNAAGATTQQDFDTARTISAEIEQRLSTATTLGRDAVHDLIDMCLHVADLYRRGRPYGGLPDRVERNHSQEMLAFADCVAA